MSTPGPEAAPAKGSGRRPAVRHPSGGGSGRTPGGSNGAGARGQHRSALEKALATLQAISTSPQSVGLPDLAAQLGLPRQTLHRVLGQLERLRLVIRDPARERFSVGPRLTVLALETLWSLNQSTPVRAILKGLVDEITETCHVGVLHDLDYVDLQRVECAWPLRVHQEMGARLPAHCVSGGKVLLAYMPVEQRASLLKGHRLSARTPHTMTRISDLEAELEKVRARGFALNNQEFMDGIVGVAVPVRDADGNVRACLGVHGPLPRLSLRICERHVPRLRQAAARIGRMWSL